MEIDPEDFKQLIGILQKLVETNVSKSDKTEEREEESTAQINSNKIRTSNKKSKVGKSKDGGFVNKFLDMKEATMHKNDSEIDKKLNKYPPTQRSRAFKLIDVKCRVCGKNEQVAPGIVESISRYKCNKCSTSPG